MTSQLDTDRGGRTARPRRALAVALAAVAALAAHGSTAHAGWAPATRVVEGSPVWAAGLALAPDGTISTAFTGDLFDQSPDHLDVAVKPPGGAFGAPQRLSTTGTAGRWGSSMASDDEGNVALVWTESLAGTTVVRGVSKRADGGFTSVQNISDTGSDAERPQVDIAAGTAVVAWEQGERVRAATAKAGQPFQVHDPLSQSLTLSTAPVVAVAPDGAAVVAWSARLDSGAGRVQAAARSAGGEFAPLEDVAQLPSWAWCLRIATSAEGRATLAWSYRDFATPDWDWRLQSASRGRTGDFGGVESVDMIRGGQGNFALDTSPGDTSLLAWPGYKGQMGPDAAIDPPLNYALRPEGGGFGATKSVPGSGAFFGFPQVKFGAAETAHVVWRGVHAHHNSVHAARIAPDGSSTQAETLAIPVTAPETNEIFGQVWGLDVDAQGNAAVAWSRGGDIAPGDYVQEAWALEARIFDTEPPVLTDVQVPATAVTGQPLTMSASASDALTPVKLRWRLGKYLSSAGSAITHTYDAAGPFGLGVEATDAAGNSVSESRVVQVSPGPSGECPPGQICE